MTTGFSFQTGTGILLTQSRAFFNTPEIPLLYSGEVMITPSAALISLCRFSVDSGFSTSSSSPLYRGKFKFASLKLHFPYNRTASKSNFRLSEPFRNEPHNPMIFLSVMHYPIFSRL